MTTPKRIGAFKKAGLAIWGMLTLILVFTAVLMAKEMLQRPASQSAAQEPGPNTNASSLDTKTPAYRKVDVYFASKDGRLLVAETRELAVSSYTVDNCREALHELILGPRSTLTPIISPKTEVYALYLLAGGELVINLSMDLLPSRQRSTSSEALMVYGIVNTLTQPALEGAQEGPVRTVRILVEGSPVDQSVLGTSHLDLSVALSPDPQWLMPSASPENGDA